jgi:hypothetical protein
MKKIILSIFTLLFCSVGRSQKDTSIVDLPRFEFAMAFGGVEMIDLPSYMDELFTFGYKIEFCYNLRLAQTHYITIGAGLQLDRYIVDGLFTYNNGIYDFESTPDNYKQNQLRISSLQFPLMYKAQVYKGIGLALGGYVAVDTDVSNEYKIQSTTYEGDLPTQNKFQWGLRFDMSVTPQKRTSRLGIVYGLGLQYQVSGFLDDQSSFHPLFGFFRLGLVLE